MYKTRVYSNQDLHVALLKNFSNLLKKIMREIWLSKHLFGFGNAHLKEPSGWLSFRLVFLLALIYAILGHHCVISLTSDLSWRFCTSHHESRPALLFLSKRLLSKRKGYREFDLEPFFFFIDALYSWLPGFCEDFFGYKWKKYFFLKSHYSCFFLRFSSMWLLFGTVGNLLAFDFVFGEG